MMDFFFPHKKNSSFTSGPKCTGSVFVLSVSYKRKILLYAKKRQSLWKWEYTCIIPYICIQFSACNHKHLCTYIHAHIPIHAYTHIHTRTWHTHILIYKNIYKHTHIHAYIYSNLQGPIGASDMGLCTFRKYRYVFLDYVCVCVWTGIRTFRKYRYVCLDCVRVCVRMVLYVCVLFGMYRNTHMSWILARLSSWLCVCV